MTPEQQKRCDELYSQWAKSAGEDSHMMAESAALHKLGFRAAFELMVVSAEMQHKSIENLSAHIKKMDGLIEDLKRSLLALKAEDDDLRARLEHEQKVCAEYAEGLGKEAAAKQEVMFQLAAAQARVAELELQRDQRDVEIVRLERRMSELVQALDVTGKWAEMHEYLKAYAPVHIWYDETGECVISLERGNRNDRTFHEVGRDMNFDNAIAQAIAHAPIP